MPRPHAIAAVLLCALMAPLARSQAANVDAQVRVGWTLPTVGQPGNVPLTGADALTKNQLWLRTAPIADTDATAPTVELAAGATSYTTTLTIPNGSTIYARLKSCTAKGCSTAFSVQDSRQVMVVLPNAPSGVAITVTVTISTQP
jgi:hypothetical protein